MKNRISKCLYLLCIVLFTTSCFCFQESGGYGSVRTLNIKKTFTLCDAWSSDGHTVQLNGYCGFPSSDENRFLKKTSIDKSLEYSFKTNGLYGFRIEKYICPPDFSYSILGIGLDLSQANLEYRYLDTVNGIRNFNELIFRNNRAMLSLNMMTLVKGRFIGYATIQGGLGFVSDKTEPEKSGSKSIKNLKSPVFSSRIGYGIQYYSKRLFGLTFEVGYGGGAYARAGVCYWIH